MVFFVFILISMVFAWRRRLRHGLSAIVGVLGFLVASAFAIWFFFFIVARVAYVPQVMLVEGKGVIEALGRSISLREGKYSSSDGNDSVHNFRYLLGIDDPDGSTRLVRLSKRNRSIQLRAMAGVVCRSLQLTWTIEFDTAYPGLDAGTVVALRRRASQARRLRHRVDGVAPAW